MDDNYELRYHVGDRVRVREWDDMAAEFQHSDNGYMIYTPIFCFVGDMKLMCGKVVTIDKVITSDNAYRIKEGGCYWTDAMLEPIDEELPDIPDAPELLDFLASLPVQITKDGGAQK